MKSAYQIDREMMAAWLEWTKAQEEADRAEAEYDKAAFEMKKCLEEAETKQAEHGTKTGGNRNDHQRIKASHNKREASQRVG